MNEDLIQHVKDPARLAALHAVALLDTPTEEAFDRLSRLAARYTNSPVALVSLVDADRQFFKSCIGLPEPWSSSRESELSHSFCQHNRIAGRPLLIPDARNDPQFKDNLAIRDLNVIAYLGIPLATSDLYVLGSFCVIDSKPRAWTQKEVETVSDLAAAVMTEIELRTEISRRKRAEADLKKALSEVKTLSGLLPICMHCKKIRDDKGYWNQLEDFISSHSDAQFSHGLCEVCLKNYYPEED